MKKLILLVVLLAACGKKAQKKIDAGHADDVDTVPAAVEPAGLRLADEVTPLAYRIALTEDPTQATFHGTVEIDVTIARSVPAIWLHAAKDLVITKAEAVRGGKVDELTQTRGTFERVGLTAAGAQPAGPATLRLTFDGAQDPDRTGGVRRREDQGDWYVVTQHEATSARRTFPCFDEPRWKTPFELTLTVPEAVMAVSNAPIAKEDPPVNGTRAVHFAATPPLPTYLTAFAVGPFEAVDAGTSRTGAPIRIIVPKGRSADAAYARVEFPRIQAALEDYLGSPYPFAKLDHLVVPSQPRLAMENPGMITYPPRYALIPPGESVASKALVVGLGAHELAHMWFGDLVTMTWWDDVWLNEAFATWMAAKIVGQLYPELGGAAVASGARKTAFDADGKTSSRQIRNPVTTEAELDAAFDGITYQKGATVIAMFERWLGPEVFQQGVRSYLGDHAWRHATAGDFLAALDAASGRDVTTPFSTFLDQAGAPVIEMEVDCPEGGQASLLLHQRRHLLLGAAKATGAKPVWQVPVCVRSSNAPETPACTLLTADDGKLPLGDRCPTWLAPNAGGLGYYRSAVSPPHDRLDPALAPAEATAFVVDLSLAINAGEVGLDRLLGRIGELLASDDKVIRDVAVNRLEGLVGLVDDADRAALAALITKVLPPLRAAWAPDPKDSVADDAVRGRVSYLLAILGVGDDQAAALAKRWLTDHTVVPVSLAPLLLGAAVRTHPDDVFEPLLALATTEPDAAARRAALGALGEVEDVPRLTRALDLLLADDPTPGERLAVIGATTPVTQGAVLDFVKANLPALLTHLGDDWHGRLVYAPCLPDRRDEVAAWLTQELAPRPEIGALPVTQAIEAMDQCIAVRSSLAPQLASALDSTP